MAKPIRVLLPLVALCALAAVVTGCGSSLPGDAVAKVGDQKINNSDFQHRILVTYLGSSSQTGSPNTAAGLPDPPNYKSCIAARRKAAGKPKKGQPQVTDATYKSQCAAEETQLKQSVLQTLIQQDWILGETAERKITVTNKQVVAKFNQLKKQEFPKDSAYKAFLKSSHLTYADLLQNVQLTLLTDKLKTKITNASPKTTKAQILAYYNKNKATFGVAEKRTLQIILNKDRAKVVAARDAITSGTSWAAAAKQYSTDPSKSSGGALANVTKGQQDVGLDNVAFSAARGVIKGPIKTTAGFYLVRVVAIVPKVQQNVAQATPQIKQILAAQNQQTALNTFVKRFTKKWTAKTTCRNGYTVPVCKNYKAAKTSTSTAAGSEPAAPSTSG